MRKIRCRGRGRLCFPGMGWRSLVGDSWFRTEGDSDGAEAREEPCRSTSLSQREQVSPVHRWPGAGTIQHRSRREQGWRAGGLGGGRDRRPALFWLPSFFFSEIGSW